MNRLNFNKSHHLFIFTCSIRSYQIKYTTKRKTINERFITREKKISIDHQFFNKKNDDITKSGLKIIFLEE